MKLPNFFLLLFISFFIGSCSVNQQTAKEAASYENGAVITAHPVASEVGVAILKKGGNAVDAAIAVKFALAVVYPNAGNLGGGGFMVYRGKDGQVSSLDFREKAPAKAHRDMYLDQAGNQLPI